MEQPPENPFRTEKEKSRIRTLLVKAMESEADAVLCAAQGKEAHSLLRKRARAFLKQFIRSSATNVDLLRTLIGEEIARLGGSNETEPPPLIFETRVPLGDMECLEYQLAFLLFLNDELRQRAAPQEEEMIGGENVVSLEKEREKKMREARLFVERMEKGYLAALDAEEPSSFLHLIAEKVREAWEEMHRSPVLLPHLVHEAAEARRNRFNEQLAYPQEGEKSLSPSEAREIADCILFLSSFLRYCDRQKEKK